MFANGLQDGTFSRSSFEYESICRFSAHLCLFLQMIEVPIPPEPVKVILESYLAVLEASWYITYFLSVSHFIPFFNIIIQDAGQRDLIALYAGALGDNAVARYAAFLVSLGLSVDINERRLALTRANEHGLNVERVAIVTAERTIEKVFSVSIFFPFLLFCVLVLKNTHHPGPCTAIRHPTFDHQPPTAPRRVRDAFTAFNRMDNVLGSYIRYRTRASHRHPAILPQ